MNLINYSLPEEESKDWLLIKDFRKHDFEKIKTLTDNMYNNIKLIEPEFNFNIKLEHQTSPYLEDNANYYNRLTIVQKYLGSGKYFISFNSEINV